MSDIHVYRHVWSRLPGWVIASVTLPGRVVISATFSWACGRDGHVYLGVWSCRSRLPGPVVVMATFTWACGRVGHVYLGMWTRPRLPGRVVGASKRLQIHQSTADVRLTGVDLSYAGRGGSSTGVEEQQDGEPANGARRGREASDRPGRPARPPGLTAVHRESLVTPLISSITTVAIPEDGTYAQDRQTATRHLTCPVTGYRGAVGGGRSVGV